MSPRSDPRKLLVFGGVLFILLAGALGYIFLTPFEPHQIQSSIVSDPQNNQEKAPQEQSTPVFEKTVVNSDPVKACIDQTRWHHSNALHVPDIEVEDSRVNCKRAIAAEKDNPDVNFGMARIHYMDRDYDLARVILERLIKNGHANSAEFLADMYYFGEGVDQSDKKFSELAHKAYALGSIRAGNQLYHVYYWGHGVMADDKLAVKYLEEAAARGDSL